MHEFFTGIEFLTWSHPVTSKQPHKIVQILLGHPVKNVEVRGKSLYYANIFTFIVCATIFLPGFYTSTLAVQDFDYNLQISIGIWCRYSNTALSIFCTSVWMQNLTSESKTSSKVHAKHLIFLIFPFTFSFRSPSE